MGKIAVASRRSLLRIFVLALCALPMHGQTANTGAIAGTVGDPSGALVAGAALVVKVRPHTKNAISLRMPEEVSRSHSWHLATMT